MASIYQNATITIAASKAVDESVGIFPYQSEVPYLWRRNPHIMDKIGEEHPQTNSSNENQSPFLYIQYRNQWQSFPIHSKTSDNYFWMSLEPSHGVLTHQCRRSPSDVVVFGMPVFTRAWFLQERLMSPRIIHFGIVESLWECDDGLRCECKGDAPKQDYSQTNARALYAKLLRSPRSRKPRSLDPSVLSHKGNGWSNPTAIWSLGMISSKNTVACSQQEKQIDTQRFLASRIYFRIVTSPAYGPIYFHDVSTGQSTLHAMYSPNDLLPTVNLASPGHLSNHL